MNYESYHTHCCNPDLLLLSALKMSSALSGIIKDIHKRDTLEGFSELFLGINLAGTALNISEEDMVQTSRYFKEKRLSIDSESANLQHLIIEVGEFSTDLLNLIFGDRPYRECYSKLCHQISDISHAAYFLVNEYGTDILSIRNWKNNQEK
jgi:hypothetical protein